MTDEEVQAIVSFGHLRRGDRLQVDIHDPGVAALIRGGYLKINWKEPRRGETDRAPGPDGAGTVPADRVDSGDTRDTEAQVDGTHQAGQTEGHFHGTPDDGSAADTDG